MPQKTYKREFAVAVFIGYLATEFYGFFNPAAAAAADKLRDPAFALVGGAFALDAVGKQIVPPKKDAKP